MAVKGARITAAKNPAIAKITRLITNFAGNK